jgi:hypothetical protein
MTAGRSPIHDLDQIYPYQRGIPSWFADRAAWLQFDPDQQIALCSLLPSAE